MLLLIYYILPSTHFSIVIKYFGWYNLVVIFEKMTLNVKKMNNVTLYALFIFYNISLYDIKGLLLHYCFLNY
jgi:hypothetical protein